MNDRLISHSEVDQFNQCEMKHHFAFTENLQPIRSVTLGGKPSGLAIGSMGHVYMETFLQGIKERDDIQTAKDKGISAMFKGDVLVAGTVLPWVTSWTDLIYPTLGWKIIEVEYAFDPMRIAPGLKIPGKIDAIIEYKDPKLGNVIAVVDHKFQGDATAPHVEALLPQMPKYIGVLRTQGIPAKMGIYNYIRTRDLKASPMDRFKQSPIYPTPARIRESMIEHIETAKQIENGVRPVRTANKINCTYCGFVELCTARLNGEDTKALEKHSFEVNTYGYNQKEIEE